MELHKFKMQLHRVAHKSIQLQQTNKRKKTKSVIALKEGATTLKTNLAQNYIWDKYKTSTIKFTNITEIVTRRLHQSDSNFM